MHAHASRSARPRAFTLLEVLLAVGAAAIIAVGIAAVFAATGDIVSGGQRISRFSGAAARIEAQLRADIADMTRDGYLVIRNELALEGEDVALFDGQFADRQRARRVDELLFFTRGSYATAREALIPGYVARADAARVYYGHGMPINESTAMDAYDEPELDDEFSNSGGGAIDAGSIFGDIDLFNNPNAYAADWILLRQVTLLTQPTASFVNVPSFPPLGLAPVQLLDTDVQVALQPAASHVFRALNTVIPDNIPNQIIRAGVRPRFPSGLVDIATTTLAEIRSVIVGMQTSPASQHDPVEPGDINGEADFSGPSRKADRSWAPPPIDVGTQEGREILANIHSWMLEGLPAYSHAPDFDKRVRIRCEPTPPDFLGVLEDTNLVDAEPVYRAADQMMLTASDFVPNCSEFIVEWSYGEVFPDNHPLEGQIVWHGLERHIDFNRDGNLTNNELVAFPYDPTLAFPQYADFRHTVPYRLDVPNGNQEFGSYPVGGVSGGIGGGAGNAQAAWLVHGLNFADDADNDKQLFSFFGYHDPTFNPLDPNRDGNGSDAARADSLPWPWPKMLRITMSLADPVDPSIEETFQFVVELPGNPDP